MPYPSQCHNKRHIPHEIIAIPHQDKQVIEIILMKPELLHDIEAVIKQIEQQRDASVPVGSPKPAPLLSTDAADNYLIQRYIDTAVNQAVKRCSAYLLLPSPFVHRISTNHTYGWEEKSIFLAMPMQWPPHAVDALRDSIHNYIVERVVQLFLLRLDPKASEASAFQAELCWNDINANLSARMGPIDIQPTFLG